MITFLTLAYLVPMLFQVIAHVGFLCTGAYSGMKLTVLVFCLTLAIVPVINIWSAWLLLQCFADEITL